MTETADIITCDGDAWLSARLAMRALREMGIRQGTITPTTDDERRQQAEGARKWRDLDCVRLVE